jgi:hypothetical protein
LRRSAAVLRPKAHDLIESIKALTAQSGRRHGELARCQCNQSRMVLVEGERDVRPLSQRGVKLKDTAQVTQIKMTACNFHIVPLDERDILSLFFILTRRFFNNS